MDPVFPAAFAPSAASKEIAAHCPFSTPLTRKHKCPRLFFSSWVEAFDVDMRKAGRLVALLLDNCSGHHIDKTELTNMRLSFFLFFPTELHSRSAAARQRRNSEREVCLQR